MDPNTIRISVPIAQFTDIEKWIDRAIESLIENFCDTERQGYAAWDPKDDRYCKILDITVNK